MKILFDHNVPIGLAQFLSGHEVTTCLRLGWTRLSNGKLIAAAEDAGFDLMITADQNIRYQQNLSKRKIAIVELTTNNWPGIRATSAAVAASVGAATIGSYAIVEVPILARKRRHGVQPGV